MHISTRLSLQAPIKEQEAMARGILMVRRGRGRNERGFDFATASSTAFLHYLFDGCCNILGHQALTAKRRFGHDGLAESCGVGRVGAGPAPKTMPQRAFAHRVRYILAALHDIGRSLAPCTNLSSQGRKDQNQIFFEAGRMICHLHLTSKLSSACQEVPVVGN
jgi:hypothetical protein